MYIIVKSDLSPSQQSVQAIHAALEVTKKQKIPDNLHLVLCQEKDTDQLSILSIKLQEKGVEIYHFYEPDLNNELTAIASAISYDRKPFKKLKLL